MGCVSVFRWVCRILAKLCSELLSPDTDIVTRPMYVYLILPIADNLNFDPDLLPFLAWQFIHQRD